MSDDEIIESTISFVKAELAEAEGGHDWWHIFRVWSLAKHIQSKEHANQLVVELGALLHDIADSKFHDGDEDAGPKKAATFLKSLNLDQATVSHVENIVRHISFKGESHVQVFKSIELDIVQDADRLEALGAIGIARTFNYGGHKGRKMYDPEIAPIRSMSREEYKKGGGTTINHFYEKLLLLKDRMNTSEGRRIAQHRHAFVEQYLNEFYKEWNGEV